MTLSLFFHAWYAAAEGRLFNELSNVGIRFRIVGWNNISIAAQALLNEDTWKDGVVVDVNCERTAAVLGVADAKNLFSLPHYWLFVDMSTPQAKDEDSVQLSQRGKDLIPDLRMLSDSEVIWAQLQYNTNGTVVFELLDVYRPTMRSSLIVTRAGHASSVRLQWLPRLSTTQRRKNLHGVRLKAGAAIRYPKMFTGMHDVGMRHYDTWTKITYPLVENLAQDFNFSFDVKIMDTYGWQVNGTFDGLMGLLQRKEVEIAASALFMRHDRMKVLDFAAEAFYLRTAIMFRQPTLSSMSNIFVMPFSNTVWICCVLLCIVTVGTFGLQVFSTNKRNIEKEMTNVKWMDIATFVLGAICQQGAYMTPTSISARITMFIISLASLFLFTSYSANIVALLQTPSNAIKTVSDLVNSPIKLGLQDVIYNRVYLKESTDTQTRRFYLQKVAPLGEKVFHNVSVGMERVRQGMYAFQVDRVQGYKEISDTYTEREKCGLKEIELFPLAPLTVATGKHSGLREMFAQRVRWQREVGIFNRLARVWLPQKPVCENRVSGFVSVGIIDFYPALLVLQYGIVASIVVFLAELFYFYRSRILQLILFRSELPKAKTAKKTKAPAKVKKSIAWVD